MRQTEMVMFHECTHYHEDLFGYPFHYPHNINEAMAEYYGASSWDTRTKTLKTGLVHEGRLAEVKSDIDTGRLYTLKELLDADAHAYEAYYWGWSFAYFLMSTPEYQKKYKKFFVDLSHSNDVQRKPTGQQDFTGVSTDELVRVFKDRMGMKDLAPLEKQWHEFVKKLDAPTVRGYEEAGKRAFGEGRVKFRAPRLLKQAVDMGSKDRDTYLCYARCLRQKNQNDDALAMVEKAIELDPVDGELWAERGYMLQAKGDSDGYKQMLALAKEIDPDGDYIDFVGIASKFGGGGDGN